MGSNPEVDLGETDPDEYKLLWMKVSAKLIDVNVSVQTGNIVHQVGGRDTCVDWPEMAELGRWSSFLCKLETAVDVMFRADAIYRSEHESALRHELGG